MKIRINNWIRMNNLASVLSFLMSKNGLTSSELARRTRVAQPVVYRLMNGDTENPQILTLKPIADYFGVSIEQLLGFVPLNNERMLNKTLIHEITTKLTTIRTIASILEDMLPLLIEAYQKASSSQLIKEPISPEVLPLLPLNIINIMKATNYIQHLITPMDKKEGI
jgi:transcriptional regulator with XRE-family HTH domain